MATPIEQNIEKIVLSDNNKLNIQDERVNQLVDHKGAVALGNANPNGGNGSFAAGTISTSSDSDREHTQALGYGSVALGCGSKAYAYGSVAMGNMCKAGDKSTNDYSAYNAIAGGAYCEAKGTNSIALGSRTIASGLCSFAGGNSTKASGEGSFAFGTNSNTTEYEYKEDKNATKYPEARTKGSIALGCGTKAYSYGSIAIGDLCEAGILSNSGGYNAFAGGSRSLAQGSSSFAFGGQAKTYGPTSLSIGYQTEAQGAQDVALGYMTIAKGNYSFAGGYKSQAANACSFSFGDTNDANGICSIAIGFWNAAEGNYSFAGGQKAIAIGTGAFAFGTNTTTKKDDCDGKIIRYPMYNGEEHKSPIARGMGSVALGCATEAFSYGSVAFGNMCKAGELTKDGAYVGYNAIAGGAYSHAKGVNSVALGNKVIAEGPCSFAGGQQTKALGLGSFAFGALSTLSELEGIQTEAGSSKEDKGSIALGIAVQALGSGAMAIGCGTKAATHYSFAGGKMAQATGLGSFAFGISSNSNLTTYPTASGKGSVALGCGTKAYSYGSIAIGDLCEAGIPSDEAGWNAFAGGARSLAKGINSVALGVELIANEAAQCVVGRYNVNENNTNNLFIVGSGFKNKDTNKITRKNAFRVNSNGNIYAANSTNNTGADYAEYFEWQDGNSEAEDRIGYVVTLDEDKIRLAQEGEEILGVISGTAGIVGDSGAMDWQGRFVKDAFGRIIYDEVEEFEEHIDPETQETIRVSLGMAKHPRISPDYDPEQEYIPREERPEWACVGMFGKLYVRDDGTCIPNAYARCVNGVLTYSSERTNIRVMKRTDSNIVYVFLK